MSDGELAVWDLILLSLAAAGPELSAWGGQRGAPIPSLRAGWAKGIDEDVSRNICSAAFNCVLH